MIVIDKTSEFSLSCEEVNYFSVDYFGAELIWAFCGLVLSELIWFSTRSWIIFGELTEQRTAQRTFLKFKIWNKKFEIWKFGNFDPGPSRWRNTCCRWTDERSLRSGRASLCWQAVFTFSIFIKKLYFGEPPLRFEFSDFERCGVRRSAQERVGTSGLFCGELFFETSVFWIIFRWINFAKHKFWIILRVN